jgi:hypothetical protein
LNEKVERKESLHADSELSHEQLRLLDLLWSTRYFEATDPRDRIYALLSLASDVDKFPIPNYGADFASLYPAYSREIIGTTGHGITLLNMAGMDLTDRRLPTWVHNLPRRQSHGLANVAMQKSLTASH